MIVDGMQNTKEIILCTMFKVTNITEENNLKQTKIVLFNASHANIIIDVFTISMF